MKSSLLRDVTPQWFARQSEDIRRFIWVCCLMPADRQELWRGLTRTDKQQLLIALHIGLVRRAA